MARRKLKSTLKRGTKKMLKKRLSQRNVKLSKPTKRRIATIKKVAHPKRTIKNKTNNAIKKRLSKATGRRIVSLNPKTQVKYEIKQYIKKKLKKATKKQRAQIKRKLKLTKKPGRIKKLYQGLENTDIHTATKYQLKRYLSDGVELINEAYPTMNKASKKAVDKAKGLFGENSEGGLLDSFSSDNKLTLLEKADIIASIIEGDYVSAVGKIIKDYATEKAYKSFMKGATGKFFGDITKEQYDEMMTQLGRIQQETTVDDSKKIVQYLHDYGKSYGYKTVGDIFVQTYYELVGKKGGFYAKDFDIRFFKNMKSYIDK